MSAENPHGKKPSNDDNWHEHILASIDPKDKRALLNDTRRRMKKLHGTPDHVLDKLYGADSRKK